MASLLTPLTEIKGIGEKFAEKLSRLDLYTLKDLLYYFPFRYQDFSQVSKISDLKEGEVATITGVIEKITMSKTWKRKMYIIEIQVIDDSGKIKAIWFNQKFLITMLKKGMAINLAGKISFDSKSKKLYFSSPVYEIISRAGNETRHTARLVPVYSETRGITSKGIRLALSKAIKLASDFEEFLPKDILKKNELPEIYQALCKIHFPKDLKDASRAEKRFAFQDLFLLQLVNASEKLNLSKYKAHSFDYSPDYIKELMTFIPFELTLSQKRCLFEILEDLKKNIPTNRLLQGDVGSGKTIVSAIASLVVAKEGKQAVFMAPTEVLAKQHYETFKKIFDEFSGGVALMTSSQNTMFFGGGLETESDKKEITQTIKRGKVKIIIGTHSVIQKGVSFLDLGLIVIDEQHRFGVNQRAKLTSGERKDFIPHLLSMSATPIPRTLALTVFSDLDLSIINELPKDRKPIITKVVKNEDRLKAYEFIREQVKKGRQAFVICPRIDPPDPDKKMTRNLFFTLDAKSVKEEYEKLSKKIFPDLSVAMLHGKMKSVEKNEIMTKFKNRDFDILVSTSVVEVGVDVPNASIMMIEGSERFGLSQLYQFRGRVGRGEHQSFCLLFSDLASKTTYQRLKALVNAKNGFELAEMDLKFRGPGQFLGQEQTGLPDLAMKAIQNPELVKSAKDEALKLLVKDPELKDYKYLGAYLKLFRNQIHLE